ncbi:trypsin-7-like [Bicyclus anynana]|uniref:Trypsin-7-like n=1 Tax=Bicyclus anynana TaxID=110368 RepID=A0ABM3LGE3_BICAN|nr:trypsin-7-like [Bicyclus anynana]
MDIVSRVPGYYVSDGDNNRIVGGYNATIQQYPYQAYLLIAKGIDNFQCGGSIISTRYILTAAHCLPGATGITARIGSTFSMSGGTQYTASLFRGHPMYNPTTFDYDVAFMRTRIPMTIDGINTRIISLAPRRTPVPAGTILTVSGWGATMEDGNVVGNLMAVQVPAVSSEDCRKSYSTITARMVCAGVPEGGKDSCGGDSGGPAVSNDGIQRGIVSNGIGCARPNIPGVYTNVSSVRSWIRRNTGV